MTITSENYVILLEFNELCPSLMNRFMEEGKLPNFQRFYQESEVYTTDAEEQPPYLEPWIQWITVHSGKPYRQRQIFNLDDGHKLKFPNIWDILSESAYRVWVCGSMSLRYAQPINGYILPDYWATQQDPYPAELNLFFNFVRRQVQEHTNDSAQLSWQDYWQFLTFMVTHGLSLDTMRAIAQQLLKEKQTGCYRWQRVTILDKLQRDVFVWYYRRFKPHFSTFFLNSTAHFQQMYWRNMKPGRFQVQPSAEEQAEYENAILYGYQEMDKLIGNFLQLANRQTTLILCTATNQQPCFTYKDIGEKHLYRPRRFEELLTFAGVTSSYECSPVMAEEFFIRFKNEADAEAAEQQLAALRVDRRSVLRLRRQKAEIYAGCGIFEQLSTQVALEIEGSYVSTPFFNIFYHIEDIKSGIQHSDGILWIRNPSLKHAVHIDKVSLVSIAPAIMDILEGEVPVFSRVQQLV